MDILITESQLQNLVESDYKPPKMPKEWIVNTANLIRKGGNWQKMANRRVIEAYFPVVKENWTPTTKSINKFLSKHPEKIKQIINTVNEQLKKYDGQELVDSRYKKKMGTVDLGLKDVDLGYFNLDYTVDLQEARLKKFTGDRFTGSVEVFTQASVPDGIFQNVSGRLTAKGTFNMTYVPSVIGENIKLSLTPNYANINTSWIGFKKNMKFPSWMDWVLGALSLLGWSLLSITSFAIKNNNLKLKMSFWKKTWINTTLQKLPVNQLLKKYAGTRTVSIPKKDLMIEELPKSSQDVERLANDVAGGFKVEKTA